MFITFPGGFLCPDPCITWAVRTILPPHSHAFWLHLCCKMSYGRDAKHFPGPAAQLQSKYIRGETLRILRWFWGQLGMSWVHITAWECLFLLRTHGKILCSVLSWEWGWDAPSRSKGEVVRSCFITTPLQARQVPRGEMCSEINPCYPCSNASFHHAEPGLVHLQCPLQGMPAHLQCAN